MAEIDTNVTEVATETTNVEAARETEVGGNAELERLKAEIAKQKLALDKATSEAASMKKQLRAKQTAEEAAAEEAKLQQDALMQELETLRMERAVSLVTAKVMPLVGSDSKVAGQVAEYLYGAKDVDLAIDALSKAWTAREKALRLEYGKIPAPGAGASDGPILTKAQLDSMKYIDRVKFATEHPDEYNKLMGR